MLSAFEQVLADEGGKHAVVRVTLRWNPRRRTRTAFHFQPNGGVLMDVPLGTSVPEARRLLRTHSRWVLDRCRATARGTVWFPTDYVDGAALFYRGRQLSLRLTGNEAVELRATELLVPAATAKAQVWAWYARQADAVLAAAVADTAARLTWLAATPPWRHRYMKSRWGSFSSRGRTSLNTHLVKLPDALVEYVVIHEFCHAKHMNHGNGFQRLLDASLADWRDRRAQLREYGGLLAETAPGG